MHLKLFSLRNNWKQILNENWKKWNGLYILLASYIFFWHEAIIPKVMGSKELFGYVITFKHLPRCRRQKSALAVAKRQLWYLWETNVVCGFLDECTCITGWLGKYDKNLETKPIKKKEIKWLEDVLFLKENTWAIALLINQRRSLNYLESTTWQNTVMIL